jgi:hypothetical protein
MQRSRADNTTPEHTAAFKGDRLKELGSRDDRYPSRGAVISCYGMKG